MRHSVSPKAAHTMGCTSYCLGEVCCKRYSASQPSSRAASPRHYRRSRIRQYNSIYSTTCTIVAQHRSPRLLYNTSICSITRYVALDYIALQGDSFDIVNGRLNTPLFNPTDSNHHKCSRGQHWQARQVDSRGASCPLASTHYNRSKFSI
eukprot:SAG31_NODE_1119_length_9813_cov_49.321289_3_plen_150_part_00